MVFPFGVSVGDFVAVIELVHDVCQALKESAGSRSRFLRLVEEFEHLEEALLAVSRLTAPEGFEEQLAVIKTAAARCEGVILAFLHKNSRFILAFEAEKSKQWWRSPLRKVEWQLYKRDDVEETYRSLQGHTAMIGLLLNAFHINCTYRAQMSWDHKTTALVQCFDKIDGQQTVMAGLFQTMLGAAATMRTEGEQQVGKIIELLNSILELQKLSSSVPAQVLREQPVYFSDACGHLTTFDLSFIASEDAFLYVLQKRFDPRGAKRIEKKQFALQDGKTKRDIDQGRGWKSWFWPGQSVEMSMIFADVERRETNSCPRCGCFSDSALDADAQWYARNIVKISNFL